MADINIVVDGQSREVAEGSTGLDLFGKDRSIVVMRVDAELRDLATPLTDGAVVEAVTTADPEGIAVMRHSYAHVVAQAAQGLFSDVKLGIGPPIRDGFFYDFGTTRNFTPEDLAAIEAKAVEILKSGQRFERRVVDRENARKELSHEPFKIRLLGADDDATVLDDVREVGGTELTIYDNIDMRSGER